MVFAEGAGCATTNLKANWKTGAIGAAGAAALVAGWVLMGQSFIAGAVLCSLTSFALGATYVLRLAAPGGDWPKEWTAGTLVGCVAGFAVFVQVRPMRPSQPRPTHWLFGCSLPWRVRPPLPSASNLRLKIKISNTSLPSLPQSSFYVGAWTPPANELPSVEKAQGYNPYAPSTLEAAPPAPAPAPAAEPELPVLDGTN